MSQKTMIIMVLVLVVGGGALFLFSQNKNATLIPPPGQGKAVIGISDATTDISGVTSVMLTVDKVEVQIAAQGWITVSSSSKQYDLLQLKQTGAVALLADINLPVGTYDQIRLTISKVEVTSAGKVQEAKLPSGMLQIVGRIAVEEGKTTTAVLDFKADKSLHVTGNGQFIMAPVVNFQTKRDASVKKQSDDTLTINGGEVDDDVNIGMDEHGDTKDNFELDANAKIEIDAEDVIHVSGEDGSGDGGGSQNSGDGKTQGKGDSQSSGKTILNFSSENNSGIAGTATLENDNGKTKVTLKLNRVSTGVAGLVGILLGDSHPAHIHSGSCPNVGPVKYALEPTVDGESETTINASLATLKAGLPLAINVHKSSAEIGVYVACVDLKF